MIASYYFGENNELERHCVSGELERELISLPLTGRQVVDMLVTEPGEFECGEECLTVVQPVPSASVDEVRQGAQGRIAGACPSA